MIATNPPVATPFSRTLRSIERDESSPGLLRLGLGALTLALWAGWMLAARVPVRLRSDRARVEAAAAAHPVEVPVGGRVRSLSLTLGQRVRAGDVLVSLDSQRDALERDELLARRAGLDAPCFALREQLAALARANDDLRSERRAALASAQARVREAEARAAQLEGEAARQETLLRQGFGASADTERARAEARERRAAVEALRRESTRVEYDALAQQSARQAAMATVRLELARAESERATLGASIARLTHLIERQQVRAPVDGRVGDIVAIREGTVLAEGARVATVVPDGALRLVAWFRSSASSGRIHVGQPVRVRFDGFAWAEWGLVDARVERVGSEDPEGVVRVECALASSRSVRIPLQHGMPGVADVEIERVAPWDLVVRAAGRVVQPDRERAP